MLISTSALMAMASGFPVGLVVIIAAVLVVLFLASYVKAPPNRAYIISGNRKKKKILIGRAGFRVPFLQRLDKLSLDVMQVDIKTSEAIPTNEFINVTVDGVANIKISSNPELLERPPSPFWAWISASSSSWSPRCWKAICVRSWVPSV